MKRSAKCRRVYLSTACEVHHQRYRPIGLMPRAPKACLLGNKI